MRKNYYLIFLTLFATMAFSQKVTLTPTTVNGTNYSSGAINLASVPYSTIQLGVKVEIPDNVAVGDNGTLKIYFSKGPALGAGVAIGGDGGSLYFGGGKVGLKDFVINLNWTDFPTSGGYIFAEYKSGTSYYSSNIAVIKNSTMNSGTTLNPPADAPNPTNIANTVCCNQTIRLGDKPAPITGSNYLNPYKNEPYGISYSWSGDGNISTPVLSFDQNTLNLDYVPTIGTFTIYRSLGYSYKNDRPNKSNTATITVVPSPISSNIITVGEPTNSEGFIELSSVKKLSITGYIAKINLNILQDPFHVGQRGDNIVNAQDYKWEYTKTNSALGGYRTWITIPNENLSNLDFYDPSQNSNSEDTYYLIRRVATYQNIANASEPIKVVIRAVRYENTICCDQILKISSITEYEKPQIITGSTPTIETTTIPGNNLTINYITYQWQVQNIERSATAWSDITGAISKDYLPSQPLTVINNGRGSGNSFETSYNYRRITKINYQYYNTTNSKWINELVSSYSNQTSLTGSKNEPYLKIYPNPTSSVLNIESTFDITTATLIISNVMGAKMNSNYSFITPNLISIDVSNLPSGTYFISISNDSLGFNQKTFIKQ